MSEIKNQLDKLLKEPTFVVFENVPLTGELTHFLYSEGSIKKIYFIKYDIAIFNQAKQAINNKEVYSIETLTTSHFNNDGIIYCLNNSNYFNPNYSLIANQKNIKAICFLGFPESSFAINPKSKDCIVTNKPISELITSSKVISAIQHQTDTNKTRTCHNRNIEKNTLVNFLANANERVLLIHGFPGFGKSNLLDELKRKAPNREYFLFNFESKSDTYKDIIGELSPYFSLSVSIDELRQTQISDRNQRKLVKDFFDCFNLRENTTLIFESVHKVAYHDSQNTGFFISADMRLFFELLITHNSFKNSNKIIFISRAPLQLNDEIRRYSNEIKVKELEPFYIKRIMADEYNRINRPELSVKIGTFADDEKINTAICGHPALALRFVDASLNHGLEELLNNEDFRSKIGYELKVKWLLDNYPLEENEKNILETLALFTSEIPEKFININFNNAHAALESLANRYLVDTHFYKDGTAKYFVPNLIKDYIKGISKLDVLKKNHLTIADYFWNKAEDITVSSQEKILSYRKAFYHFRESGNHEKLKLLVMRFKEKFIIEAMESTREKLWQDAYFYFNELHLHNQIGIENPREYNQFIKVLSRINPKPKNATTLIEEIHKMFPNDSFIAVTFADYLFDKSLPDSLQDAIKECYRIKYVLEKSEQRGRGFSILDKAIVDNTLAKCLYRNGKSDLANVLIERWRSYFSNRGNTLTDKEKYHYQAILMTQYRGLEDFETYLTLKKEILQEIKNEIGFLPKNDYFTDRKIYCTRGEQSASIELQFEKVLNFKHDVDKVMTAKKTFAKNLIDELPFINELKMNSNHIRSVRPSIDEKLNFINGIINTGKQLLSNIISLSSKNNFPAEYSLIGLMEVEADFNLLKIVMKNIYKES